MTLRIARDDDVERLWPVLAASRTFPSRESLEEFRAAGPWRVLIDEAGRAAVLERWRPHLDILGMKGLWCAEKDVAPVLEAIRAVARDHGYGRIMSPLIPEDGSGAYVAAGMEPTERIVALRMDTRVVTGLSPRVDPGIELLVAEGSGAAALERVDEACFPPFWRYGRGTLGEMLKGGRVVAAHKMGQVVGYTWCTMDRGIGTLGRIAVSPDEQRHGIGGVLLADALGYLARAGADAVSLCTQEENVASRALYARAGFRELPGRLVFLVRGV